MALISGKRHVKCIDYVLKSKLQNKWIRIKLTLITLYITKQIQESTNY